MCVFSVQILSETFLILRRTEWDMNKNVQRSSYKVSVILVRFSLNLNFLDRFSKNNETPNFTKIRPVGAELFHADRQTEITKLRVAIPTLRARLNSSYTTMLQKNHTVIHNGEVWQQGTKEAAGYKRRKTQEAGINYKTKRFVIYIVNIPRYHVVRISKTRWIADVTTRTRGHDAIQRYSGVVLHNLPLHDERAKKLQLHCFYGPNKSYEPNKAGFLQRYNTP